MTNINHGPLNLAKIYYLGHVFYDNGLQMQKALATHVSNNNVSDQILILEHNPVFTLGRNASRYDIHANDELLYQLGIETRTTDRGGQVTYHGPQQMVVYPICNLKNNKKDVRFFVHKLEQVMIRTAADFGIEATTLNQFPGVWVKTTRGQEKLGALGLHIRNWITTHGLAFNVAPDLSHFQLITPCGITDKDVCSLNSLLGDSTPTWHQVINRMYFHLNAAFEFAANSISYPNLGISIFIWRYSKDGLEFLNLAQQADSEVWSPSLDTVVNNQETIELTASNYLKEHVGLTETLTTMALKHTFLANSHHATNTTWKPNFINTTCFHAQIPADYHINLTSTKYKNARWCNFEASQQLVGNSSSLPALVRLKQILQP